MRRLLPDPADSVTIPDAYRAPLGQGAERPWLSLCMVASIDGSTMVDGASAGLSSDNDIEVLSQLRSIADVIIVGAGTVRGEGYGPPKKKGQRIGVLTRSGSVDTRTELFTTGAGFVITTNQAAIDDSDVDVLRAGDDDVDLREAIIRVPELCPGARVVQAEGGPTINAALGDADLIDELNLTVSPLSVGGSGLRLLHDGSDHSHRFELAQLFVDDESFLFTRWQRRREIVE